MLSFYLRLRYPLQLMCAELVYLRECHRKMSEIRDLMHCTVPTDAGIQITQTNAHMTPFKLPLESCGCVVHKSLNDSIGQCHYQSHRGRNVKHRTQTRPEAASAKQLPP